MILAENVADLDYRVATEWHWMNERGIPIDVSHERCEIVSGIVKMTIEN
jgi:hypothetical protein